MNWIAFYRMEHTKVQLVGTTLGSYFSVPLSGSDQPLDWRIQNISNLTILIMPGFEEIHVSLTKQTPPSAVSVYILLISELAPYWLAMANGGEDMIQLSLHSTGKCSLYFTEQCPAYSTVLHYRPSKSKFFCAVRFI